MSSRRLYLYKTINQQMHGETDIFIIIINIQRSHYYFIKIFYRGFYLISMKNKLLGTIFQSELNDGPKVIDWIL